MDLKLSVARFIRWRELQLASKVYLREYVMQQNVFADQWKDFHREYHDACIDTLVNDLDPESIALVHLLLKRFSNPFSFYHILYPRNIFTDQELADQQAFNAAKHQLSRKFKVPFSQMDPSPMMYQCGLNYVPENVKLRIKDSVVYDVGAYLGLASQSFLEHQPSHIFAFEPSQKNYDILDSRLRVIMKDGVIIPVNCALGDSNGFAYINDAGNASAVTLSATATSAQQVIVTTIDSFTQQKQISRVGLIKVDVEGFEMKVMGGARETIIRDRPVLLISIYHTPTDFFKIKPMLEILGLGYRFHIRKTSPFWLTYDTMLIGYIP